MKNIKNTVLLLCLVFPLIINSQNSKGHFGVLAGGNYFLGPNEQSDNKLGFFAGGFFNLELCTAFKLQAEVHFASYAKIESITYAQANTPNAGFMTFFGPHDFELKEKTVQLPVMAQYYFTKNLYAELGPHVNYKFDRKLGFKEDDPLDLFKMGVATEMDNQFDVGISFGTGYYLTDSIAVFTRYYNGLTEAEQLLHLGLLFKV